MSSPSGQRLPLIDALKVIASQLIVLHHLAFYGPMTDHIAPLLPGSIGWLSGHARIAVQIFLVVGGLLAAQRMLPQAAVFSPLRLLQRLVDRYLRLMLPLAAALVLAVAAAALAHRLMVHHSIPDPPTAMQWLAHLLLLQDVAGYDALSAGIWFVAIAFQLHLLLLLLAELAAAAESALQRRPHSLRFVAATALPWAIALAVAASALHFNRHPRWDVVAPYHMAAYGLGVLVAWSASAAAARAAWWFGCASVAVALLIDWRERLALALALALLLWSWQRLAGRAQRREAGLAAPPAAAAPGWLTRCSGRLARSSYSLFLVHFPVLLLVNALFTRFAPAQVGPQAVGVLLAWFASVGAGELFHRWVEIPLMNWLDRPSDQAHR